MKAIRVLLQIVIIGAGEMALVALIFHPDSGPTDIVVFAGFLIFFFSLTLLLKEHTKERLTPGHKLNLRSGGVALLLLGMFGLFYGASYLSGLESLPDGTGYCRKICDFILLVTLFFGEAAGKLFAFSVWSALGLFLCLTGYKIMSKED